MGIQTSIPFFLNLLQDEEFLSGLYDTGYLTPSKMEQLCPEREEPSVEILAALAMVAALRDQKPSTKTSPKSAASAWKWHFRNRS